MSAGAWGSQGFPPTPTPSWALRWMKRETNSSGLVKLCVASFACPAFTHLLHTCLLGTYYVPGPVQDGEDTVARKTYVVLQEEETTACSRHTSKGRLTLTLGSARSHQPLSSQIGSLPVPCTGPTYS